MRVTAVFALILLLGLSAFFWATVFPPGNLQGLSDLEKQAASEALRQARSMCLDNPLQRGLTRALVVKRISLMASARTHKTAKEPTMFVPDARGPALQRENRAQLGYVAYVQAYTLFGIPTQLIRVVSSGSSRCFNQA